ncbi:MAG: hypothetical protein ACTHKL_27630 [Streptosporangiaceae bacterium]
MRIARPTGTGTRRHAASTDAALARNSGLRDARTSAARPWATRACSAVARAALALCHGARPARARHPRTRSAGTRSPWTLAARTMAAVSLSAGTAPVTSRLPPAAAPRLRLVFVPPVLAQRLGSLPVRSV